jgi:hypothetical protein
MVTSSIRAQPQWFWVKWENYRFVFTATNRATSNVIVLNIKTIYKMVKFKVEEMVVEMEEILVVVMADRVAETEVEVC